MMIAVLQVTLNERLKGVFTLRKSWKVFEKALKLGNENKEKLDPELLKSLNFGAGVFLFAMSIIPSKFMKLVKQRKKISLNALLRGLSRFPWQDSKQIEK